LRLPIEKNRNKEIRITVKSNARALRALFSDPSRIVDALLVFVPIAIVLALVNANYTAVFITSALGIIPLAGILGEATDALAHRAGSRVGALLNATFGNAAELIITITAIRAGLIEVVKASITGSIIGNILLVLGLSVLVGGLKNGFQQFGRRNASVSVTMMAIAVIGLAIPATFSQAIESRSQIGVEYLSIGVAIALMFGYVLSLIFIFRLPEHDQHEMPGETTTAEHVGWSVQRSLVVLAISVIFIAVLSEILVGAIEPLVREQGLTELFVGVIVVPIIGNAAEHLVAIEMAMKNKMELALGIALGSSMQVALFVAPLLVFISLLAGNPMSLVFNPFELVALIAAVLIAALIALDGESNWLEGAQLIIVYVMLALAFFFLPV
jgi:Ca2+:H+ antiporter